MKAKYLLAMFASVLLVAASVTAADKDNPLEGITCPVSGKKVVAESATPYKEGQVYFCCKNCPNAFKKDTAKFAAKANAQLVATGQYKQVKCPLTGKDCNPSITVKIAGVDAHFCCNGCKGKASKAEGAEQISLVFNDKAFAKGFAPAKKKAE